MEELRCQQMLTRIVMIILDRHAPSWARSCFPLQFHPYKHSISALSCKFSTEWANENNILQIVKENKTNMDMFPLLIKIYVESNYNTKSVKVIWDKSNLQGGIA